MNKIINYIYNYNNRSIALKIFDYAIAIWLMIHCFTIYFSIKNILFSTNNLCSLPKSLFPFEIDILLYKIFDYDFFTPAIIALFLLSVSLFFYSNIINKFLIWFIFINLFSLCTSATDGGDTVFSNIMFVYMFCSNSPKNTKNRFIEELGFFLTIIAIQYEIVLIYLQAAFSKIKTDGWSNGVALYYILQQPEFSNPFISKFIVQNDWLVVIGTFATIIFQLLFLPAVFSKSFKLPWLFIGLIFHLAIFIFMGLFSFSLLMIISYLLFLHNDDIYKLKNLFSFLNKSRNQI